jgi:D-alanyl-D-alanine endopeptidase (penicillin-binding protein 7)
MKSSKVSLNTFRGASRHVVVSFAFSAVLGVALGAPSLAFAATPAKEAPAHRKALHHKPVASAKVAQKGPASKVAKVSKGRAVHVAAVSHAERVHGHITGRRHGTVHAVAYSPRPAVPQAFGLHDSPDGPALRSSVAYVVDQATAEPLIDKNSNAVVPIASISKLMMAMVTLDAKMPLTDTIIVTDEDRDYEKGTGSRLSVGSRLSREDMLHIALMSSENRAAAALSRYYPGGRPAFVAAMNKKAHDLGMTDTHFDDPTGLNYHNVSSGRDLVKMVEAAYKYPLIRNFSTTSSYDVDTGRRRLHYGSTNSLVRSAAWDIGLQKTGFINEAGECLVMQTTIHSRPVVMVLLDSVGKYSRTADAQRVRTWLLQTGAIQRLTSADNGHSGT